MLGGSYLGCDSSCYVVSFILKYQLSSSSSFVLLKSFYVSCFITREDCVGRRFINNTRPEEVIQMRIYTHTISIYC